MFHRHVRAACSPPELDALAARARTLGFEPAGVDVHGQVRRIEAIRDNERLELHDEALAAWFAGALRAALGDDFPARFAGAPFVAASPRLRFYRYAPGQRFRPHRDGAAHAPGATSRVTALLYLNDADGGETVLMPAGPGADPSTRIAVAPRAGDALLFEHALWHEGRPVASGEKLVLRADLLYADAPA